MVWSIVSKAFDKSRNILRVDCLDASDRVIISTSTEAACEVECFFLKPNCLS